MRKRVGVVGVVEAVDRDYVPFDRESAQEQLSKAARLLAVGVGAAAVGNIPGDPGQRLRGGVHYLIDARRWSKEPSQIADRELNAVQNIRKRCQLA
jgi:hypothetical protein